MVLERFLSWVAAAPADARAEAARALVAAYSRPDADRLRRDHLDHMTAVLLDDPVVAVRRALAEAAAASGDVPRHLVAALTQDVAIVAAPVLRLSSLLTGADLIDAIAAGDGAAHAAIASRAGVPATVAAALVEEADRDAVLILCENPAADLSSASVRRILDRFGHDGTIREALICRDDLEPEVRHDLAVAAALALTDLAVARGWMAQRRAQAVVRDSSEKAAVTIAALHRDGPTGQALASFAAHLRASGRLTPALLLRSLLSGVMGLFEAALGELAGLPPHRACGVAGSPSGLAFASLYARATMPPGLLPAFRAALAAARRCGPTGYANAPVMIQSAIAEVRAACVTAGTPAALLALLDRLEAEALRDDIRVRRRIEAAPRPPVEAGALIWLPPRRPVVRVPLRSAA